MTDALRGFRHFVTGFEARQSSVVTSVKSLIPHPWGCNPQPCRDFPDTITGFEPITHHSSPITGSGALRTQRLRTTMCA